MYDRLLGRVPKVFVGTAQELTSKVDELTNGVESCFQYLGRELPPWRTKDSLNALYKVCLENEGAQGDRLMRALEAEVWALGPAEETTEARDDGSDVSEDDEAEADPRFPAAALRELRRYLQLHQLAEPEHCMPDFFADNGAEAEARETGDIGFEVDAEPMAAAELGVDGQQAAPSNLTLLMLRLRAPGPHEHPHSPAPMLRDAWSTLVPGAAGGSMRRVKRLHDLEAHDQSPL